MHEILDDVKSGALPLEEVPGFVVWLLGKAFWPVMFLATIGGLVAVSLH